MQSGQVGARLVVVAYAHADFDEPPASTEREDTKRLLPVEMASLQGFSPEAFVQKTMARLWAETQLETQPV